MFYWKYLWCLIFADTAFLLGTAVQTYPSDRKWEAWRKVSVCVYTDIRQGIKHKKNSQGGAKSISTHMFTLLATYSSYYIDFICAFYNCYKKIASKNNKNMSLHTCMDTLQGLFSMWKVKSLNLNFIFLQYSIYPALILTSLSYLLKAAGLANWS